MRINSPRLPNRDVLTRVVKGALIGPLPRLVSGVLALLIAYVLALLTWQLVPHTSHDAPLSESTSPRTQSTGSHAVAGAAISEVVAMHLFGVPQTHETSPKAAAMNAPETQLNVTLRGLFTANHARNSYAIIAVSGGEDKQYGVGAQLPGGAKVHAIYADRVIISRNGQLEALKLPQEKQNGSSISTGLQRSSASSSSGSSSRVNSRPPINIQRLRQKVKRRPKNLMKVVRPAPVTKNGNLIGYRVYPGQDSQTFNALGLESGDVIKSINGIALDDPKQSMQILKELSTAGQLNATIERNGKQQSLTLSLNDQ